MAERQRITCLKPTTYLMCRIARRAGSRLGYSERMAAAEGLRMLRRDPWESRWTLLAFASQDWPDGEDDDA